MATDLEITKEQRHTAYAVLLHLTHCKQSMRDLTTLMASAPRATKLTKKVAESVLNTYSTALDTVQAEHDQLNAEVIEALKP